MEENSASNMDGNHSGLSIKIVTTGVKDPKLPTIPGYIIRNVGIKVHDIGYILGNKTTIRMTESVLQKLARIDGKLNKTTSTIPTVQETETVVDILNPSVPVPEPLRILMEETCINKQYIICYSSNNAVSEPEPKPKLSRTGRIIKPKKIISPGEFKKSSTRTTKTRRNPLMDDTVNPRSSNNDTSSDSGANPGGRSKSRSVPPPRGRKHFFTNFEEDVPRTARQRRKSDCSESSVVPEKLQHSKEMNESSEIGLVEIEIGDEVPSIAATGSCDLNEPSPMNDCEIEMLTLAYKAASLESSTASQPETTISDEDNRVESQEITFPVTASENPIEIVTQQVSSLVRPPRKIKLPSPTPGTLLSSVSDNVQDMIPEPQVEEENVEAQKTHQHQPFLLFNNGPTLVAGRIYISALEGQPLSLWRYNGVSFDPFGVPAITEIIKDCTKENVAQDVNENTNVPSSSSSDH